MQTLSTDRRNARTSRSAADVPVRKSPGATIDNPRADGRRVAQLAAMAVAAPAESPKAAAPNRTGLPDQLKTGMEALSGVDLSGVRVHRNSSRPADLQAHAYAQGSEIHLASGQERHLPHEAWHIVQQAQGRVRPQFQMSGVAVNDDSALEAEATSMGARALQRVAWAGAVASSRHWPLASGTPAQREPLSDSQLNVAGEHHGDSGKRRDAEKQYSKAVTKSSNYWKEADFMATDAPWHAGVSEFVSSNRDSADTQMLRFKQAHAFLHHNAGIIGGNLKNGHAPDADNYDTLRKFLHNMTEGRAMMADKPKVYGIDDEKKKQLTALKPAIEKAFKQVTTAIAKQDFSKETCAAILASIEATKLEGTFEPEPHQDISQQRSIAMHDTANRRAGQRGVWKIGQQHVDDIEAVDAKPNYNLVTQDQFDAGLAAWQKQQSKEGAKEAPKAAVGEIGKDS